LGRGSQNADGCGDHTDAFYEYSYNGGTCAAYELVPLIMDLGSGGCRPRSALCAARNTFLEREAKAIEAGRRGLERPARRRGFGGIVQFVIWAVVLGRAAVLRARRGEGAA
jgi:hypothetical protein